MRAPDRPSVPVLLSSGDLLADRRYQIARDFFDRGDVAAARDLLRQAVEIAPNFAAAWLMLGSLCDRTGDRRGAIAAYRHARASDPADHGGASLWLAARGAGLPPAAMPRAYVRTLFDQYAARFDSALTDGLHYRGPALLHAAVVAACRDLRRQPFFARALDLGCGTGLTGAVFRASTGHLSGVDLAPAMLAQARAKKLYDRLETGDVAAFLRAAATAGDDYDLVLAADLMPYVRELGPLFGAIAGVLRPGGLFAFTAETHAGDGVVLRTTLRFAHGRSHIRSAAAAAGLRLVSLDQAWARHEARAPAPGLVVVARHR